jgi:hypothetical protein
MQRMNRFRRPVPILVLLLFLAGGCGSGSKPGATVSGKVTYKGEAVPAGEVVFNLVGKEVGGAIAPINSDGTYKATGVPVGQVVVTVTTPPPPPTADQAAKNPFMQRKGYAPKAAAQKTVSIPAKYGKPALSGLSFTVNDSKQPQPFDIDLK